MPTTKPQKLIFALITVIITVHLFVFYNLNYVNGLSLSQVNTFGVPVCSVPMKLYAVIVIEFVCALTLELLVGSPLSFRIASRLADIKTCTPFIFETLVISATVLIMCPAMSLIATVVYGWSQIGSVMGFFAFWLKTIMHNFPLALFSQIFFIQPFVRFVFRLIFRNRLAKQSA